MFNSYDLANVSLAKPAPSSLAEMYIPLWVYSSGSAVVGNSTPQYYLLNKGTTSVITIAGNATACKLYTLNPNWSSSTKFAFEVSIISATSTTCYAQLCDLTSGSIVPITNSQISTTSTTATLLRSGQFTLTPGHVYGVSIWSSSTTQVNLSKAHLVAFLS